MRQLDIKEITRAVAEASRQANQTLPPDIEEALHAAAKAEPWPLAQKTLAELEANLALAEEKQLPICQDTGMACVFLELGQDVHLAGGNLQQAVDEGVRQGYAEGFLRKSVVGDPIRRGNTGDNTPALLTVHIVPGRQVGITVAPKGFGSENMSHIAMLKPSDGRQGVVDFVLDTMRAAGPNPCPPVVLGVGIGGSFDKVALLAKQALLRPVNRPNPDPYYAELEAELLEKINRLGIGPAGYGGRTSALGVAVETLPTHIAGLPVAVNVSCHATRRASVLL